MPLIIYLLFSVRKAENSEIWPYLENLPESYDTPLEFWPEKFNQFLMKHVRTARETAIDDFHIRFDRIDQTRDVTELEKPERRRFFLEWSKLVYRIFVFCTSLFLSFDFLIIEQKYV